MRIVPVLAASAMFLSLVPAGMAAVPPDHSMPVQLVRGGGFGGHFAGFHGGYAIHRGFGYHHVNPYRGYGRYPYAYSCAYPYYYGYGACFLPNG